MLKLFKINFIVPLKTVLFLNNYTSKILIFLTFFPNVQKGPKTLK